MALKALMHRNKIDAKNKELKDLERAESDFVTREAELETSIGEAATDEERSTVEAAIETFDEERSKNTEAMTRIRGEIATLESELKEIEKTAGEARSSSPKPEERTETRSMEFSETRHKVLGLTRQEVDVFMARQDVKDFAARVREFKGQGRSVTGAELGVPEVCIGILRDNINRYSKLLKYISIKPLKGKARQNVAGAVPEAIWTEAAGALNDIDIVFSQVEMDGYKVAGFLAIPNSTLEDDTDLELLSTVMDMMGQAIGYAVDKAIAYGTGAKMPVGFVTRLACTAQPSWWGTNQGTFTDLHSSNILKLNISTATGVAFFAPLISALGVARPNYSTNGQLCWIMNRKTHIDILTRCMAFDFNAALLAGMQNTMPVIGGDIVELEFMANYEVGGGYLDLEKFVERAGVAIGHTDQVLYVEDQTVFKATQRLDGKCILGEAFVLVNYANVTPTTSVAFGTDYANTELGTLIVTTEAGTDVGDTKVSVSGNTSGATLKRKLSGSPIAVKTGDKLGSTWSTLDTTADVTATTGSYITVVEVDASGKAVKAGAGVVTSKAAG